MDKKFAIQFVVLLIVIFAGLFSVFQPGMLGLTSSIIPGGGNPYSMNTGTASTNSTQMAVVNILFIDAASTGNPELVKSVLKADVADTAQLRAQGLSGRQNMDENSGMIFAFEQESQYNFIMRNMMFPLDFIWVKGTQIVDLLENIQPDPAGTADKDLIRYAPKEPVNRVIEVNAGYIARHNLKVGDRIKYEAANSASASATTY